LLDVFGLEGLETLRADLFAEDIDGPRVGLDGAGGEVAGGECVGRPLLKQLAERHRAVTDRHAVVDLVVHLS